MNTWIFIIWTVFTIPTFIVLISIVQLYQSRKMIKKLGVSSTNKLKIRINQMLIFMGGRGGLSHKAEMYVTEDFILITPKKHGYFNVFFNYNLPVLVYNEKSKIRDKNSGYNGVIPENFKVSTWNSISFKYRYILGKFSVHINLLNKEDSSKIEILKNWC